MIHARIQQNDRLLSIATEASVLLFIIFSIIGNYGPELMRNGLCFTYLGCNTGFFGFDAVVHFVSGAMTALIFLWVMRRFPQTNMLQASFWKDMLIIISFAVLVAFMWEFVEFLPDQYRLHVLHMNLIHPDQLYQASNVDTMGDMTVAAVGALLAAMPFLRGLKKP